MPRTKKPTTANQTVTGIATEFEKIEYRKVTIELDTRVHDELTQMIGYIETTRDIKPALEDIINRLLRKAVQSDSGYNSWKANGGSGAPKARGNNQSGGEAAAKETTTGV